MSLRACLVLYVGVGPACRLYRSDGSQVFSDEEHAERLGKLTEGLREKAEAVAAEARSDVIGYEREVLALSYADFASLEAALEDPKAAKRAQGLKEEIKTVIADVRGGEHIARIAAIEREARRCRRPSRGEWRLWRQRPAAATGARCVAAPTTALLRLCSWTPTRLRQTCGAASAVACTELDGA